MWLILALGTALMEAVRITIAKGILKKADEYFVTWAHRFFALPIGIALMIYGWTGWNATLAWVLPVVFCELVISNTVYMKAVRVSPISLTMPYLAFTPLFLLITSKVMLGESPDTLGYIGILSIVVGVYVLNLKKEMKWWEPFAAIKKEKGSVYMLIVAFIYSIGGNLDKIAVQSSSSWFYVGFIIVSFGIFYAPIMLKMSKNPKKQMRQTWKPMIWMALANVLVLVLHMLAIKIAIVPYVIAIKRLAVLFAVIFGWFFYKEKGLSRNLSAATIMVAGAVLIAL